MIKLIKQEIQTKTIMTIIIFILVLALLVLVHEFGHFIAARKSGMKVYEFGFGFPPRAFGVYKDPVTKQYVWLWGKGSQKSVKSESQKSSLNEINSVAGGGKREEEFPATVYSINWLPLGGFCKIKGEEGEGAIEPDSFGFQKAWKKIIVLVAGVVMNFLLAAILLGIGLAIGLPADFSGGVDSRAIVVQEPRVMIQGVDNNSPAKEAGLQMGDTVISLDNQLIKSSLAMTDFIKNNGDKIVNIKVERAGKEIALNLTPKIIKAGESSPRLGVILADAGMVRYPWHIALYKGFVAAAFGVINIFIVFFVLIKNLIIGKGLAFDVSGPVGIAVLVGQSAKLGINYLINITAMISLSLAAMNILPIPALDGGRVLFVLIEKIFRRPVPVKYEQLAHTIGFLLLMLLVILITFRDIKGLF